MQALPRPVAGILLRIVGGVEQVVNVGFVTQVMLVTVDDLKVFLLAFGGQRLVLVIHSVVTIVLLGKAVLGVPDGVSGGIADEELDEAVVKLELPE